MLRSRSRDSESESLERPESEVWKVGVGSRKFWKGRSRIFYLRLCNPDVKGTTCSRRRRLCGSHVTYVLVQACAAGWNIFGKFEIESAFYHKFTKLLKRVHNDWLHVSHGAQPMEHCWCPQKQVLERYTQKHAALSCLTLFGLSYTRSEKTKSETYSRPG